MREQSGYLAIDIGGTKTLLAVFNSDGEVIFEHKTKTDKTYPRFLKDIESALNNELKDFDIRHACCAFPGMIDRKRGIALRGGNISWENEPLKKDLEKILVRTPVLIENDAKLAGLSEAILVHKEYKKVLYLTISTGIGGGVIINGKIDPVLADMEPGWTVLEHNGKLEKWEDFASGQSLHKQTGKLASEIDDPAVWREYAKSIALGMEQLLAIIQPEVVIIGGGVGAHFEKFAKPLREELMKLETDMVRIPPVIKAYRPEEAVIYGCYQLIKQQSKTFIKRLQRDFPDFKFLPGEQEHWSPGSSTITYKLSGGINQLRYGVLHELAHAQLDHRNYQSDFELLKMESEAWELAAKIGRRYGVEISDEHIQNCLDTYRDWLHRRSACPTCGMHVMQNGPSSYHCFNCQTTWEVTSGRFVRPYRRKS